MQPTPSHAPAGAMRSPAAEAAANVAQARRRVAAIKGFYIHLLAFGLVVTALFAINATSGGSWWVLWVVFGWGIGVAAHALAVFGRKPRAIAEWEERKVRQIVNER